MKNDKYLNILLFANSMLLADYQALIKWIHSCQYLSQFPDKKPCRIIVLDNNIPQISLYYKPIIGDSVPEASRRDWDVSYDLGGTWKEARKIGRKNSSLFKVDVVVYPEVSLKNLIITQIYQVLFNLSPAGGGFFF